MLYTNGGNAGRQEGKEKDKRRDGDETVSQEACLLCIFSCFKVSEKEKARGKSADSERKVSSGRNPWLDFLTSVMGCEKMLFVAVRGCRELGDR